MSLEVLHPGLQTTVQDLGRSGFRALGVGLSGAADSPSLRLANTLVGNAQNAAGLELTLQGPRLRFAIDSVIAICGADIATELTNADGTRALSMRRPLRVRAGEVLRFGACQRGARAYLAVAGGIAVTEIMGSRSTDLQGRFGGFCGRAVQAGDTLPLGSASSTILEDGHFSAREEIAIDGSVCTLRVLPGTHGSACLPSLIQQKWQVAPDASRMGVRLLGPRIGDANAGTLISEPVTPGTVQLPPDGAPILLGVEAPTTGGYPRIAHVIAADVPRIGQLRPGGVVRFERVTMEAARAALAAQEQRLALVCLALQTKKESACSARSI